MFKYVYDPKEDVIIITYKASEWSTSFTTTKLVNPAGGWNSTITELYEWLRVHLGLRYPDTPKQAALASAVTAAPEKTVETSEDVHTASETASATTEAEGTDGSSAVDKAILRRRC